VPPCLFEAGAAEQRPVARDAAPSPDLPLAAGMCPRSFVSANVAPALESLLELLLADKVSAAPEVADPSDPDSLFAFLEARCGDSATYDDFATAEDEAEEGKEADAAAPRRGVSLQLSSGVDDVDGDTADAAMGPLMRRVVESAVVRCAADEPEDARAWLRSFFADCRSQAGAGTLEEFLGFDFRPHAPKAARRD